MGLFSSKQKRGILEIFGLQFNPGIEEKFIEENKTEDYTDFSIKINEVFNLFDKATFRFFSDKPDLSGSTSFNLFLRMINNQLHLIKFKF